jgi:hypothetical protein
MTTIDRDQPDRPNRTKWDRRNVARGFQRFLLVNAVHWIIPLRAEYQAARKAFGSMAACLRTVRRVPSGMSSG